jgi:hypothetical protein
MNSSSGPSKFATCATDLRKACVRDMQLSEINNPEAGNFFLKYNQITLKHQTVCLTAMKKH